MPTKAVPRKVAFSEPEDISDAVKLDDGVWEVADEVEGSRIEEKAPRIPEPTISEQVNDAKERIRSLANRVQVPRLASKAKKPGVRRPRTSVEGLISTVWSFGARMLQNPVTWPVANVLAIQSPIAGAILEDVVKNTAADTVLQPVARLFKGGDAAFALVGPPVLVAAACMKPDYEPVLRPMLREALRSWVTVAGPKLLEKAKEEKAFQEEYGETIEAMIDAIFTPPVGMVPSDNTNATTVHGGQTSTSGRSSVPTFSPLA